MDSERQAMSAMIEDSKADEILHFTFGKASLRLEQNLCDAFKADVILIDGLVDYAPGNGRRLMQAIFDFCKDAGFQFCVLTATRKTQSFYSNIGMQHLVDNIYYTHLV